MKKRVNKKGAMELSMNTIVIVVIGITLLVLGLVFVKSIFTRLGGLGGSAFQKAEQELQQIQSGETKINFPQNVEVKKGKSSVEELRICNTDGTLADNSDLKLEPVDFPVGLSVRVGKDVVSGATPKTVDLGKVGYQTCRPFPVLVKTTPDIIIDPETEPFLMISVEKGGSVYHSMGATVEII